MRKQMNQLQFVEEEGKTFRCNFSVFFKIIQKSLEPPALPNSQSPKAKWKLENLSLGGESLREAAYVLLETTLGAEELDVGTVDLDLTSLALLEVLLTAERGETPVLGDNDLLATGEPR